MKLNRNSRLVRFAYWLDTDAKHEVGFHKESYTSYAYSTDTTTGELVVSPYTYEIDVPTYSTIPKSTSLCRFFWRAFLLIPIASLFAAPLLYVIVPIVMFIGGLFGSISVPWNFNISDKIDATADVLSNAAFAVAHSTPVSYFKALKQQMCPIIDLD